MNWVTLSEREMEVVRQKCEEGLTNEEAGYNLSVARDTIKNHISRIFFKLGAVSMNKVCYEYGKKVANE